MTQRLGGDIGLQTVDLALCRQRGHGEVEQRFTEGNVDMDRGVADKQGFVDETVAVPTLFVQATLGPS